jgi:hypothetical protein
MLEGGNNVLLEKWHGYGFPLARRATDLHPKTSPSQLASASEHGT